MTYKRIVVFFLTLVFLSGCSASPDTEWETVNDILPDSLSAGSGSLAVTFTLPGSAILEASAAQPPARLYRSADASWEILAQTIPSTDPVNTLRQVTGCTNERLNPVETNACSMKRYDFAWTFSGDAGLYVARGTMLWDGEYCYALSFSAPEADWREYQCIGEEACTTLGLYSASEGDHSLPEAWGIASAAD